MSYIALAQMLLLPVLALAAGPMLLLAPHAHAETLRIEHTQGVTEVPRLPQTLLVFDLAALDTLDALGVEPAGVPEGVKPAYLRKYDADRYAKIGSLFEPDFEAVAAAAPDLVIVGGRSAAQYRELSKIAPTIDMTVDTGNYFKDAAAKILSMARILDKEPEAASRLEALEASVAKLKEQAGGVGTALVIMTTGGRMSAYGPGSRFGVIHTELGIRPAAPDLTVATHGQAISFEFILKADPDYLFVIDRDAATGQKGQAAEALLDNDIVRKTRVWEAGRVVYLDPDNWYLSGTGLTAMQAMVEEIAKAIQ